MLTETLNSEIMAFIQVVFIDLILAGDNAIVVGMAAAGVAAGQRRKVIIGGIAAAVVLRIAFTAITVQLLSIIGLLLAGGILLLWVCWKLWRDLRQQAAEDRAAQMFGEDEESSDSGTGDWAVEFASGGPCGGAAAGAAPTKSVRQAIVQVVVADVSMSLDNVLAVAGAAGDHMSALIFGLALSVVLMGACAALIARILQRHHWLGYLGLALITYVALSMIWRGAREIYVYAAL